MPSVLRRSVAPLVILVVLGLALVPGCGVGDPECSCTVDRIEFPTVFAVEDTLTSTFTVRNSGDGDRLAWTIEEFPALGLTLDEPRVYRLDEGQSIDYTLRFAPQDSVEAQEIDLRVGPGDDCVIRVRLGANAPRTLGACCSDDGTCEERVVDTECIARGDRFNGEGSTCAEATCLGACCLETGTCAEDTLVVAPGDTVFTPISVDDCTALGGTYQGDGTTCEDVNCPQPLPVCEISTDRLDFVFTGEDLGNGITAKTDTITVRNTGLAPMIGQRPFAQCSGTVTFTALTNAGENGELFVIPPGGSAEIEVRVTFGVFDCEFLFQTNAGIEDSCPPVRITSAFQQSTARAPRR